MNHYDFDDIFVGMEESFSVEITEAMMESFLKISGDNNPLHCDETYAAEHGYEGRVVYGMLTASFLSTLAGVYLPGENSLLQSAEVKFSQPVFIGDKLTVKGKVVEKHDLFKRITVKVSISAENDKLIAKAKIQIGVR